MLSFALANRAQVGRRFVVLRLLNFLNHSKNVPIPSRPDKAKPRLGRILNCKRGTAILIAVYLMITDGRTFIEGLYVASYGMLSVGHGDLDPVTSAGLWFVDFWLPFNWTFLALYLGSVGRGFFVLFNKYTKSIETRMGRIYRDRRPEEIDLDQHPIGEPYKPWNRNRIRQNSDGGCFFKGTHGKEIFAMRDLLKTVYESKPSVHREPNDGQKQSLLHQTLLHQKF